jgi:hypothetical protein
MNQLTSRYTTPFVSLMMFLNSVFLKQEHR